MVKAKIKRIKRRLGAFVKKNKFIVMLLIAPFVIYIPYLLPFKIFYFDYNAVLQYYGVALGILAAIMEYNNKSKEREVERLNDAKPNFFIDVRKKNEDIFELIIENHSNRMLTNIYLYDEFLCNVIDTKNSARIEINLTYLKTVDEMEILKKENSGRIININMDDEIIDNDGYPKYVQIYCDDILRNSWECSFNKSNDSAKLHYWGSCSMG